MATKILPETETTTLVGDGAPSSKLPLRTIPGSYGIPFISPIRDRLDFYYFQGQDAYFQSRVDKYGSTVVRINVPPGPFMASDPKVVAVLDAKSFQVLFDVSKVEKKNVFTGTYMPSTALTGGFRVCSYLDPSEPTHAKVKQLLFNLLDRLPQVQRYPGFPHQLHRALPNLGGPDRRRWQGRLQQAQRRHLLRVHLRGLLRRPALLLWPQLHGLHQVAFPPARPPPVHRPPQDRRGSLPPHLPPATLRRQVRLQGPLRVLQLRRQAGSRRRRDARAVQGGSLPQPPLRHRVQQLRRPEGDVPGDPPVAGHGRHRASRSAGRGDPVDGGSRGREGDAGGGGEDGTDEVGGLRGPEDGPAREVPVRQGQEGPHHREPRRGVRGEGGGDALRVPASSDEGPEGVHQRRAIRGGPVRRRRGEAASEVRGVV